MSQDTYSRYFHTIRYLKLKQIAYRLFYACTKTSLKQAATPSLRPWSRAWSAPLVMPSPLCDAGTFSFLGETGKVVSAKCWIDSARSKLWLYNLHYFDAMNALDADANMPLLEPLLERWIHDNPALQGLGWEPYPVSLRLVNWIKWFSRHPERVKSSWLESLALQAQALLKRVEHHILGNHLFANAKALVFAGTYFDDGAVNPWLEKGLRLLDREVTEQFLDDGGHFERSPMYHAILLWDLCDLYNLALCSGLPSLKSRQASWCDVIARGLRWLEAMVHPDGEFAFFNDTTMGIAPRFDQIVRYAESLGVRMHRTDASIKTITRLKNSGYIVVKNEQMTAILDVGHIGPDYQPGHAHADTLSFELSLNGQRVIVNSGISEYGESATRKYQRSTEAHNTVCIDGKNSSDVWGGFRVSKRANPFDLVIKEEQDLKTISCSHDGYLVLPGKNIHRRHWSFERNKVVIHDVISGQFEHAQAQLFLHPAIKVKHISPQQVTCALIDGTELSITIHKKGAFKLIPSSWHANFGKKEHNCCVVAAFDGPELQTRIEW